MSYQASSAMMKLMLQGVDRQEPQPPVETPSLKTLRIFFWGPSPEAFFQPPATRTRQLVFKNLVSALLTIDIGFRGLVYFGASLNGQKVTEATSDTVDVTSSVRQGANTVRLDYTTLLGLVGVAAGDAVAYVDLLMNVTDAELDSLKKTAEAKNQEGLKLDLKTIAIIGGVAVATVGGIVLVTSLRKSPAERAIEQLVQLEAVKALRR